MQNYCSNCGEVINQNQDVCLNCGKTIRNVGIKSVIYSKISGIITIVLGIIIDMFAENEWDDPSIMQGIGFAAIIAGILALCSHKSKGLLIVSGILLIICSIGLIMLYEEIIKASIVLLAFGVTNIVFADK